MQQLFFELFSDLASQYLLTPKEVAHHTGRSPSTVYRWLRGENQPDVEDFSRLVAGVDHRVRVLLLSWLTQNLSTRVEYYDLEDTGDQTNHSPSEAALIAKQETLATLESCLQFLRWQETVGGDAQTLSAKQYEVTMTQLDGILDKLVYVKSLHRARVVERKRAKPARGDASPAD